VLIACEESQAVTIEMRKLGIEAYSCDIEPCSGGHPEWHIQGDALEQLDKGWDMMIAFPPCTHLAVSGARWFKEKQQDGRQQKGIEFFMEFANCKCEKVAIENPVSIMSTIWRKPDQIIQPWMFGHGEQKATCLWLKGLPELEPTNIVQGRDQAIWKMSPSPERAKLRSKTFPGIAKAFATQYTAFIRSKMTVTQWSNLVKGETMTDKKKRDGSDSLNELVSFPELTNGSCDGLGCGWHGFECWCDEWLESREEYQRQFKKPWGEDKKECKAWEDAWRFSWNRYAHPKEN